MFRGTVQWANSILSPSMRERFAWKPEIPNFRQWRRGLKLKAGMTLAVEPMINAGSPDVEWMDDEWTVVTYDGSLSAHYENTILITEGRPEILTLTEEERECIWQE